MSRIILIETSTSLCSTALVEDGKVVCERISDEPRAHASKTALFVSEMLSEKGLKVSDCDAVAVSKGPGSYTGLRVGVSTAKGLCFGAGIPMISVGTLDTLVWQALDGNMLPDGCRYIIPMIDARRMEVYTAVYSTEGERLTDVEAKIVDSGSFAGRLSEGKVLFTGDGALKCSGTITSPNAVFAESRPSARGLLTPVRRAWEEKRFEDIAYFEPFYLKDFVATVSKKKLF